MRKILPEADLKPAADIAIFFVVLLCATLVFVPVYAQQGYEEDFMRIEFEAEESPKNELQKMQAQLSELEFYYSELKAQEAAALKGLPAGIKNRKFQSLSEKAGYYKKLSDDYAGKLANEELSKNDIKISQNLITLSELYKTQQAVNMLKKEIEIKKQNKEK